MDPKVATYFKTLNVTLIDPLIKIILGMASNDNENEVENAVANILDNSSDSSQLGKSQMTEMEIFNQSMANMVLDRMTPIIEGIVQANMDKQATENQKMLEKQATENQKMFEMLNQNLKALGDKMNRLEAGGV